MLKLLSLALRLSWKKLIIAHCCGCRIWETLIQGWHPNIDSSIIFFHPADSGICVAHVVLGLKYCGAASDTIVSSSSTITIKKIQNTWVMTEAPHVRHYTLAQWHLSLYWWTIKQQVKFLIWSFLRPPLGRSYSDSSFGNSSWRCYYVAEY